MIRSMFTAVNALYGQQTWMDVIADNLANVNTPGYKGSIVKFKDQFTQIMRVGAAPSDALGGINPTQVGLGMMLGQITPSFTQGPLQSTGRTLDLAIQGDGFLVYKQGEQLFYSRDGSLAIDNEGVLVNASTGMRLQGWTGDITTGEVDTGGPLTELTIPIDSTVAKETQNGYLMGNLDSRSAIGDTYNATFGVYDTLGEFHSVSVQFTRATVGPNSQWTWTATSGATGNGSVQFDEFGQYDPTSVIGTITVPGSAGANQFTVNVNLEGCTMLAAANSVSLSSQDGLAAGALQGFSVEANTGKLFGVYTNGDQRLIGQMDLALFVNPNGMIRQGNNLFLEGLNSGEARHGAPTAGGRGSISSGYIEGSNVEMGRELTNMILAQRGFQANSRIITTSDEMLQELVNLKR